MGLRELLILSGLLGAGWGHLLLADRRLAVTAWRWLDGRFPPSWRSAEPVAGAVLLAMGAVCALAAIAG